MKIKTRICIMVVADHVTVNGKQLHEVLLPNEIDMVISDSSNEMSYKFLKDKKVCELTGPIESVNRALQFFTPYIVNIDAILNNEQIKLIPNNDAYLVTIRYINSNVDLSLLNDMNNVFLPTNIIQRLQPKVIPPEPKVIPPEPEQLNIRIGNDFKHTPFGYSTGLVYTPRQNGNTVFSG